MEPIDAVFDALGKLTYAEMIELARYLRDTYEGTGADISDAGVWADVLEGARVGWPERDT